jgi:hypothetical protein
MTLKEFNTYQSLCPEDSISTEAEDYILNNVVVYPSSDKLGELYMGEVSQIVKEIVSKTGFVDLEVFANELIQCRQMAGTLIEQIQGFISKAFPTYTLDELDNMNYKQLARLQAQAEVMLGQQLLLPGQEIPEEEQPSGNLMTRGREINSEDEKRLVQEAKDRATHLMQQYRQRRSENN